MTTKRHKKHKTSKSVARLVRFCGRSLLRFWLFMLGALRLLCYLGLDPSEFEVCACIQST